MNEQKISSIILAAGKGTRMKSTQAKVLHNVFNRPMVSHVVEAVQKTGVAEIIAVIGHQAEKVERALGQYNVINARQTEQLGTGHAVLSAEKSINDESDIILILCGDTPLIKPETLSAMLVQHRTNQSSLTVMTTYLDNPCNYGRIIKDDDGGVKKIVEEKDAIAEEKQITEINAGIYCADRQLLFNSLKKIGVDNQQGEMYLTDIVEIARQENVRVDCFTCENPAEVLGVNSRIELAEAEYALRMEHNYSLMASGVTLVDPKTAYIEQTVNVGPDTVIKPNVHLRGSTIIGKNCSIDSFSFVKDAEIADGTTVPPFTKLFGNEK